MSAVATSDRRATGTRVAVGAAVGLVAVATSDRRATGTRVAVGAAVGLVAGLAASLVMDRFQALVPPPATGSDDGAEPATQQVADRVAVATTGQPLSRDAKPLGGQAVHYGFGADIGVGYGMAAAVAPAVTIGAGTAFATAVWAVFDEAAVPAAGFGSAPWSAPARMQAYGFASHLVFGVAIEATRRLALVAVDAALPPRRTSARD